MRKIIGILLIAMALLTLEVGSVSNFREASMEREVIVGYGDPFIDVSCETHVICCHQIGVITVKNNLDEPIEVYLLRKRCHCTQRTYIGTIEPGHSENIYVLPGNYTIQAEWNSGGAKINVTCPCIRREHHD
ncbi:hypothetical protein [Pyrococcus abyssi]|uniref:Uncharacterized protein n=1 Tax=Pyrococcus abyssi (strain GE5 / Orsay) TaxID=272844 RepID=G8ZIQ2_PYRAB|nr:hypothetical protein [Pyrococcus abyssi]CCE70935.1 TPA: hypothetical protein PAB0984 [Pyrococcus abyssi GE5]